MLARLLRDIITDCNYANLAKFKNG